MILYRVNVRKVVDGETYYQDFLVDAVDEDTAVDIAKDKFIAWAMDNTIEGDDDLEWEFDVALVEDNIGGVAIE